MKARLVTIYWRDIPAQVNAQSGRTREKAPLPMDFQLAIDRATDAAELFTYHESVKFWRRTDRPCGPDLAFEATAEADRLAAAYPDERLAALISNLGYEA